jgi:hypothetical protein
MEVIKKNRDGLRDATLAIAAEMSKLREQFNGDLMAMPAHVRLHYSRLGTLRAHYMTQANALSFVLNEDAKLTTMQGAPMFEGYEYDKYMYKQQD